MDAKEYIKTKTTVVEDGIEKFVVKNLFEIWDMYKISSYDYHEELSNLYEYHVCFSPLVDGYWKLKESYYTNCDLDKIIDTYKNLSGKLEIGTNTNTFDRFKSLKIITHKDKMIHYMKKYYFATNNGCNIVGFNELNETVYIDFEHKDIAVLMTSKYDKHPLFHYKGRNVRTNEKGFLEFDYHGEKVELGASDYKSIKESLLKMKGKQYNGLYDSAYDHLIKIL